jgi:hypothetical protein
MMLQHMRSKFMDKVHECYANPFQIIKKDLHIFVSGAVCIYCSNLTHTFVGYFCIVFIRFIFYA